MLWRNCTLQLAAQDGRANCGLLLWQSPELTLFEHGKKITFAAFVKYQEIFFSDDYF
jgi:hypothetical protein